MRYHELMTEATEQHDLNADALAARFPGIEKDIASVAEWLNASVTQLRFTFTTEPASTFAQGVQEMLGTFDEFPNDRRRANRVARLLRAGQAPWPVFIEQGDPHHFIMEGRHRIVAFLVTEMPLVPVAYVRVGSENEMRLNEAATIKLTDLYDEDELTDTREQLYAYVDEADLQKDFVVHEMTPAQAMTYVTPRDDMTVYDAFRQFAGKEQKRFVRERAKQFDHSRIIVTINKTVLDGNHHLVAGILAKQPIKFINLAD